MSIGYACQTLGVPNTTLRKCILKTANEDTLRQTIADNLNALERILDYNISNDIKLFRISSDVIPFGSSPVNTLKWWDVFQDRFATIGKKILDYGMRVSMHPGQYTVLNSIHREIVERAYKDLEYHCKVLASLMLGKEHKMVLHIGGVYNHKEQAIQRFIENYSGLTQGIKDRLVLENDDKLFNIKDVLGIANAVQAPVIFDNLHHKRNPCDSDEDEFFWIEECKSTWKSMDGFQKIHYSQQNPLKRAGSHSETISTDIFLEFYQQLNRDDIDIMLEVKDKNLSAIKCKNVITKNPSIQNLEQEWGRYKYAILEKSQNGYKEIRELLKEKSDYPVVSFYNIIDREWKQDTLVGNGVNAAQHVWGYFKAIASEHEKEVFEKKLELYQLGKQSIQPLKKHLWMLTQKYKQDYLLNSYYFIECY
ncbi:MAG: UV DNA damage repair endonuclease UvsE [Lachnotalea sp.]